MSGSDSFVDEATSQKLQNHWYDPDELAEAVFQAMHMGDYSKALPLAQRLVEIDKDVERSYSVLAVALIKTCDFKQAKSILEDYLLKHSDEGDVVLPFYAGQLLTELNQLLSITKPAIVH